ncbi:hypothetical protein [Zobellia laminariae]|uniref:hypothetical protein n=1 Tax=Zobellia laminariae TaxID=248906 RepID=UPI0026F43525|nr:hypothetical protein [Zobellia laminariae]WKX75885.1 hypothetical protein Q5W13_20185 [Zobellia laminariae]
MKIIDSPKMPKANGHYSNVLNITVFCIFLGNFLLTKYLKKFLKQLKNKLI